MARSWRAKMAVACLLVVAAMALIIPQLQMPNSTTSAIVLFSLSTLLASMAGVVLAHALDARSLHRRR